MLKPLQLAILRATARFRKPRSIPVDPFVENIYKHLKRASRLPAPPFDEFAPSESTYDEWKPYRGPPDPHWLVELDLDLTCRWCERSIDRASWIRDAGCALL